MASAQANELLHGDNLWSLRPVMLVGPHEIAAMLGVSRQRVHQLIRTDDFPPPLAELAMGTIWDGHAVAAWSQTRTRRRRK